MLQTGRDPDFGVLVAVELAEPVKVREHHRPFDPAVAVRRAHEQGRVFRWAGLAIDEAHARSYPRPFRPDGDPFAATDRVAGRRRIGGVRLAIPLDRRRARTGDHEPSGRGESQDRNHDRRRPECA